MGYGKTLEVVARLNVDGRFRTAFLRDPQAALAGLSLTDDERARLSGFAKDEVARVGRMADYHRVIRIQEQIPWINLDLRPDLRPRMAEYLDTTLPQLLNREEAIAFCEWLEALPEQQPPYLAELARCERLRIALPWGLAPMEGGARRETFAYPVLALIDALAGPGWPAVEPAAAPVTVEYKKVPGLPAVLVRGG